MPNMRESSKASWSSNNTIEEINAGSLQRIADAAELMAKNHLALQAELALAKERADRYERWYYQMRRRVNALRGVITRMRRKAQ